MLGAVGAAVIDDMLKSMGLGWCFVFVGLLMAAATGLLCAEMMWGMGWRQKRWQKMEEKKQAEKEREAHKKPSKEG